MKSRIPIKLEENRNILFPLQIVEILVYKRVYYSDLKRRLVRADRNTNFGNIYQSFVIVSN